MGVRLTGEEDQLLQAFRRVKNGELRGCIFEAGRELNKKANNIYRKSLESIDEAVDGVMFAPDI